MNRIVVVFVVLTSVALGSRILAAELGRDSTDKGDRFERPVEARARRGDTGNVTNYLVVSPEIVWASCEETVSGTSLGIHARLIYRGGGPLPSESVNRARLEMSKENGKAVEYELDTPQMIYMDLDADGMIDGIYDRKAGETRILRQGRFVTVEPSKGGLRHYAWELGRRTRYVFRNGAWDDIGSGMPSPRSEKPGTPPAPAIPPPPAPGEILPPLKLVPGSLSTPESMGRRPGTSVPDMPLPRDVGPQSPLIDPPRSARPSEPSVPKERPKAIDLGPGWTAVDEPLPELGAPEDGRSYERPVSAIAIRRSDANATEYQITSLLGNEFGITQSDDGSRLAIEIVGHQKFEAFRERGRVVRCSFRFANVAYFDLDGNGRVDAFADQGKRRACVFHHNQFVDVAWSTDLETGAALSADGKARYGFREGRWEQQDVTR